MKILRQEQLKGREQRVLNRYMHLILDGQSLTFNDEKVRKEISINGLNNNNTVYFKVDVLGSADNRGVMCKSVELEPLDDLNYCDEDLKNIQFAKETLENYIDDDVISQEDLKNNELMLNYYGNFMSNLYNDNGQVELDTIKEMFETDKDERQYKMLDDGKSLIFEGTKYTMEVQPQADNEFINGNFDQPSIVFTTFATNDDDKRIKITWDVTDEWAKSDQEDCGWACDWNKPRIIENV